MPVLQRTKPEGISIVLGLACLSFESLIVNTTLSGVTSDTLLSVSLHYPIPMAIHREEAHTRLAFVTTFTSLRENLFSAYSEIFSE